jgi:hypothetical protein
VVAAASPYRGGGRAAGGHFYRQWRRHSGYLYCRLSDPDALLGGLPHHEPLCHRCRSLLYVYLKGLGNKRARPHRYWRWSPTSQYRRQ